MTHGSRESALAASQKWYDSTRLPLWQHSAAARLVLPTPGGPRTTIVRPQGAVRPDAHHFSNTEKNQPRVTGWQCVARAATAHSPVDGGALVPKPLGLSIPARAISSASQYRRQTHDDTRENGVEGETHETWRPQHSLRATV